MRLRHSLMIRTSHHFPALSNRTHMAELLPHLLNHKIKERKRGLAPRIIIRIIYLCNPMLNFMALGMSFFN